MMLSIYLCLVFLRCATGYTVGLFNDSSQVDKLKKEDLVDGRHVKELFKAPDKSSEFLCDLLTEVETNAERVPRLSLLAHVLLQHKHLSLPPIGKLECNKKLSSQGQFMLQLFNLENSHDGPEWLKDNQDFTKKMYQDHFQEIATLKRVALLNGDFFISAMRLQEKSDKVYDQTGNHAVLAKPESDMLGAASGFKIHGSMKGGGGKGGKGGKGGGKMAAVDADLEGASHFYITILSHLAMLNSAKAKNILEEKTIDKLRWQLGFMASIDYLVSKKDDQITAQVKEVSKLLIKEVPIGLELPFPILLSSVNAGHAQVLSFNRTKEDAYGIKVYNSGWGIDNHISMTLKSGLTKYSPFLGFQDIPWEMLQESILFYRFLLGGFDDKTLYSGMLGLFILRGKRWKWEDYLEHAMEIEKLKDLPERPKLIITQKAGTCTSGAIKAFEFGNLAEMDYRLLNEFAKIEETTQAIAKNIDDWLAAYKYKEDVRYTLRQILRNIARRLAISKEPERMITFNETEISVVQLLEDCLLKVKNAPKAMIGKRASFELETNYALQVTHNPSRYSRGSTSLSMVPRFKAIESIDDLSKGVDEIIKFLSRGNRSIESSVLKVFLTRWIGSLPLLGFDRQANLKSTRVKLVSMLLKIIIALKESILGKSPLNPGFGWDLLGFYNFIHHYAALSEDYFFLGEESKPIFTLSSCEIMPHKRLCDEVSLDIESLQNLAKYGSKEVCFELDENPGAKFNLKGTYVDSMRLWLDSQDKYKKDLTMITKDFPLSNDQLDNCLKSEDHCLLHESLSPFHVEAAFVLALQGFESGGEYPKLFRLHHLQSASSDEEPKIMTYKNKRKEPLGPAIAPLQLSSQLLSQDYLAKHSLIHSAVYYFVATIMMPPLDAANLVSPHGTLDVLYARLGKHTSSSLLSPIPVGNPFANEKLYKSLFSNLIRNIDNILDNLKTVFNPSISPIIDYLSAALFLVNQKAIMDQDQEEVMRYCEILQSVMGKVEQARANDLPLNSRYPVESIELVSLAAQRTLLRLHSIKYTGKAEYMSLDEARVVAEQLLTYLRARKRFKNLDPALVTSEHTILYYSRLGDLDLYRNADIYGHALASQKAALEKILDLYNLEQINGDLSRFPIVKGAAGEVDLFSNPGSNPSWVVEFHTLKEMEYEKVPLADGQGVVQFYGGEYEVQYPGLSYLGTEKDYQEHEIFASTPTRGISIDRNSRMIRMQWSMADKEVLIHNVPTLKLIGPLYLTDCTVMAGKMSQFFRYLSKMPATCYISKKSGSTSLLASFGKDFSSVVRLESDKLWLVDSSSGASLYEFRDKCKIEQAAELEKFPIVCRPDQEQDCKLLVPDLSDKVSLHPITLKWVSKDLYALNPTTRFQTLLCLYRLMRAFLYEMALRLVNSVEFGSPFNWAELNILRAILQYHGNTKTSNPELALLTFNLIQPTVNRLELDQEAQAECKKEIECQFARLGGREKLAVEIVNMYREHLGNLDSKYRQIDPVSHQAMELHSFFKKISLVDHAWWRSYYASTTTHPDDKVNQLLSLDAPICSEFQLPSIKINDGMDKLVKSPEEVLEKLDKIRVGSLQPSKNDFYYDGSKTIFTDKFASGKKDRLIDHFLFSSFKLNGVVREGESLITGLLKSANVCAKSDYLNEAMETYESPPYNEIRSVALLPFMPVRKTPLKVLDYWSKYAKILLNRVKNDFAAFKASQPDQSQLTQAAERLRATWKKCLEDPSQKMRYMGSAYESWSLMMADTVDGALSKVKPCIASNDIECVRRTLECPWIKRSFLSKAARYLQIKFTHNYHQSRVSKLPPAELELEVRASNLSPVGLQGGFLTWQHATSFVLSQQQVDGVKEAIEIKNGNYPEIILQRIMASGKTFTLGPLITHGKADGYHLPILVVPTALFETNSSDLLRRQQLFFGQRGMALHFDRLSDFTVNEDLFRLLASLISLVNDRGYVVTAPEAVEAMENTLIEMLDPNTKCTQLTFDAMRLLLKLPRYRGASTIDEIDTIFNPAKELNHPIGLPTSIDSEYIYMSALLQYLVVIKKISPEPALLLAAFKEHLEKEPWQTKIGKLKDLNDAFVLDPHRSKDLPEAMPEYHLIMWQQLHKWVPAGLQSILNQTYGRSVKFPHYWLAKPFKSAKVPSEESEFANPFETLNKTFAMYFAQGLDQHQIQPFFWHVLSNTENAKQIMRDLFGLTQLTSGQFDLADIARGFSSALLSSHPDALQYFLSYMELVAIPRDIKYHRQSIKSNALNMAGRFKSIMGYSGTLPNDFIFPERLRGKGAIKWDRGAIAMITKRLKDQPVATLRRATSFSSSLEQSIELIAGPVEPRKPKALIDIGALFKDHDNEVVSRALLQHWKHVRAVLFFHPVSNKIVAIKRDNKDRDSEILNLPGTDLAMITETLGVAEREYAVYFDQWHTTGTDIPLPADAHGVATVGIKTTLRDLTQGVMRMRQFLKNQTAELVVDTACGLKSSTNMQDAIDFTKGVAVELIKKENLQVAFAKIRSEARAAILDALLAPERVSVKIVWMIFDQISPFLISTEPTILELYSGKLEEANTFEVLEKMAKSMIVDLKKIPAVVKGKERLIEEVDEVEARMDRIVEEAKKLTSIDRSIKVKKDIPLSASEEGHSVEQHNVRSQQQVQEQESYTEMKQDTFSSKGQWDNLRMPLNVDPQTFEFSLPREAASIKLQDEVALQFNTHSLISYRQAIKTVDSKLELPCIDDHICVTLDYAFMEHNGHVECALWRRGIQKPAQSLILIEEKKDTGKKYLVFCSEDEAINLVKAIGGEGGERKERKLDIALLDLAGTVFLTTDESRWPVGKIINEAFVQERLTQVAVLLGSYPLLKTVEWNKIRDGKCLTCYGNILINYSLTEDHRRSFFRDATLRSILDGEWKKKQEEARKQPPYDGRAFELPADYRKVMETKVVNSIDDYTLREINRMVHRETQFNLNNLGSLCEKMLQFLAVSSSNFIPDLAWLKSKKSAMKKAKEIIPIKGFVQSLKLGSQIGRSYQDQPVSKHRKRHESTGGHRVRT